MASLAGPAASNVIASKNRHAGPLNCNAWLAAGQRTQSVCERVAFGAEKANRWLVPRARMSLRGFRSNR
jgi:hypothetical protein